MGEQSISIAKLCEGEGAFHDWIELTPGETGEFVS